MANAKLIVTVKNGVPPVSIVVQLFKDDERIDTFTEPETFSHDFQNLTNGTYCLNVGGMNPAGGSTTFEFSGNGIQLIPPDINSVTKKDKSYDVNFNFQIKE